MKNSTVYSNQLNGFEANLEEQGEQSNFSYDGKQVVFCGIVTSSKIIHTKNNQQMLVIQIEDFYGSIEAIIFPSQFAKYSQLLTVDSVVKISGKISVKENEKSKILVSSVEKIAKQQKIYIRIPKDKFELEKVVIEYIKSLPMDCRGICTVNIYYEGTNRIKLLGSNLSLNSNSSTIEKLKLAFGSENVKIK